jgi:hypothetical protein
MNNFLWSNKKKDNVFLFKIIRLAIFAKVIMKGWNQDAWILMKLLEHAEESTESTSLNKAEVIMITNQEKMRLLMDFENYIQLLKNRWVTQSYSDEE